MEENKPQVQQNKDEIDLLEVFLKIWKYKWFIIIFTVIVAIGSIIYSLVQEPQYEAEVSLYQKSSQEGRSSRIQNLASQFGMGGALPSGGAQFSIEDLINSRRLNKKIIYKNWDTKTYQDSVNLIEYWEIEGETKQEKFEKALKKIKNLISFNRDEETQLVTITVLMPEAQLAADIGNYLTTLIEEYIQTEQKTSATLNLQYIEERLETVEKELRQAEEELKRFRKRNRVIESSPELQLEQGRLQRKVTLKQEVYTTLQTESEMAEIDMIKETPVINLLDEAVAPEQRAKPKRKLIVIVGTFAGFFLSLLIVVLRYVWNYVKGEMEKRGESLKLF
ncbi:MAG: Wzz/FepE/Etk N-terminal domain-containing protein [Bacteroidota bacterium]